MRPWKRRPAVERSACKPGTATAAQPPPTVQPAATRIQFAQGATSAVVDGFLPAGTTADHVLRAMAGQEMQVLLWSPDESIFLAVLGQDGTLFQNALFRQTQWSGVLPYTQDYILSAVSMSAGAPYALRVTIPARIPSGPAGTVYQVNSPVQRIWPDGVEFVGSYVLNAFADQTVDIVLSSPNGNVLLNVVGADGMPVLRYVAGGRELHGPLYATQDYTIDAVSVGPDPSFQLSVVVSPRGGPGPLPEPTPIFFQPGAISGVEQGQLVPGGVQRYELRAMAGQSFLVRVWPERTVGIAVEGESSGYWSEPPQVGSLAIPALPATQNYRITLSLPAGYGQAVEYTIEVTIP